MENLCRECGKVLDLHTMDEMNHCWKMLDYRRQAARKDREDAEKRKLMELDLTKW